MTIIRVIDFETTGFPPKAGVCEAGWTDVTVADDGAITVGETLSEICNPGLPIEPKAESVHGISDAMVKGTRPSSLVFKDMVVGADVFCAHNAEFEQNFFTGCDAPWVCTYKVSLALHSGLTSYKNGNLPGLLGIDLDAARCAPLHRAGPDTYITARILEHFLLAGATPQQLIQITTKPKVISRMPAGKGKHPGALITDLPTDYLLWGSQNYPIPDIRRAIAAELQSRKLAAGNTQ